MSISLVAGLGNPGREYEGTRHNLGWRVLDAWVAQLGLTWRIESRFPACLARWDRPGLPPCIMAKPLTYMNDSGAALGALARFHKLAVDQVAVVYDDLAIDLGLVKVSVTGSAGGHNGVASVLEHLGDGFVRFRLGIGPRHPPQMDLKDFVLARFPPAQNSQIDTQLPTLLAGLGLLLASGPDHAMNQLNRRDNSHA